MAPGTMSSGRIDTSEQMDKYEYTHVYQRGRSRQNESRGTKRKKGLQGAMEFFCKTVNLTQLLGRSRNHLLLRWLLADFFLFENAIYILSKGTLKGDWNYFHNGYNLLMNSGQWANHFTVSEWNGIKDGIDYRYSLTSLGKGLRTRIQKYRNDPKAYFARKASHNDMINMKTVHFDRKDYNFSMDYEEKFLVELGMLLPKTRPTLKVIWKCIPPDFYVMETSTLAEVWKDRRSGELIGGRMKGGVPPNDRQQILRMIEDAYQKKWVVSRSDKRTALSGTMRAMGPLVNWREAKEHGEHFVSYYRNKLKVQDTRELGPLQLELIHEQCSHRLLFEILIILFVDNFWPVVKEFLLIKEPFSNLSEELLRYFSHPELLKHAVPNYPLFITKDYCNKVHVDEDSSNFTMFMTSNPSMESNGGHLVIVEYGIKIEILHGDLGFFCNKHLHSTAYRAPPSMPVYIVGCAINKKLGEAYEFVYDNE